MGPASSCGPTPTEPFAHLAAIQAACLPSLVSPALRCRPSSSDEPATPTIGRDACAITVHMSCFAALVAGVNSQPRDLAMPQACFRPAGSSRVPRPEVMWGGAWRWAGPWTGRGRWGGTCTWSGGRGRRGGTCAWSGGRGRRGGMCPWPGGRGADVVAGMPEAAHAQIFADLTMRDRRGLSGPPADP
jgi:hypothetical protein